MGCGFFFFFFWRWVVVATSEVVMEMVVAGFYRFLWWLWDFFFFFFPCGRLWLPLVLVGEVVEDFWPVKWWWRWLWLVSIGFCGDYLFLYYNLRGISCLDRIFFFFFCSKIPLQPTFK